MMQRPSIYLFACALVLFWGVEAPAETSAVAGVPARQEPRPPEISEAVLRDRGYVPLVEDDSLDQWQVERWHVGHWTVRDGVISYDGKGEHKQFQKNSLWTKADYGDLELYAEWRLPAQPTMKPHPIVLYNGDFLLDDNGQRITRPRLDAGDSGLLFRGVLRCQANIWSQELGSGEVNGYRTDKKMPPQVRRACIPLKNADRPLGEWNAFLITLRDNRMQVELNGEPVVDATLPNLPASGAFGLQHHGDPVQFRKLYIKAE